MGGMTVMNSCWGAVVIYHPIDDDARYIITNEHEGLMLGHEFVKKEKLPSETLAKGIDDGKWYYFANLGDIEEVFFYGPSILLKYIMNTHPHKNYTVVREFIKAKFVWVYKDIKQHRPQCFGKQGEQAYIFKQYMAKALSLQKEKVRELLGESVSYREMTPDQVYLVTRGNTDGSILTGDAIFMDSQTKEICGVGHLSVEDLSDNSMTDFECEKAPRNKWAVLKIGKSKTVVKRESLFKIDTPSELLLCV
jgi:hypothetical protein